MIKHETLTLELRKITSCFTHLFLSLILLTTLASCSVKNRDVITEHGDIIYTYKTGTIQCLSQKSTVGTIAVLVQSLKENTVITDVDLGRLGDIHAVKVIMAVKQKNPICASWTDIKEVIIPIEPIDVSKITLEGKPILAKDGVIVLIPLDAKLGFEQILNIFEDRCPDEE